MSWGDHDTELIRKTLNVSGRKNNPTKMQNQFFDHQKENDEKHLAYRDRDWYQLGWDDAMKESYVPQKEYGYTNNFAKNLKIIRVAFGFTMDELKAQSGVTLQTIGKYEKGITEPNISNLIKLAKALNVSCAYLLGANLTLNIKEK